MEAPEVRVDQLPEVPFPRVSDWDNFRSKKKKGEKKQARAVLSRGSNEEPETSKAGPPRSKFYPVNCCWPIAIEPAIVAHKSKICRMILLSCT
jgi:hypothetical protein